MGLVLGVHGIGWVWRRVGLASGGLVVMCVWASGGWNAQLLKWLNLKKKGHIHTHTHANSTYISIDAH